MNEEYKLMEIEEIQTDISHDNALNTYDEKAQQPKINLIELFSKILSNESMISQEDVNIFRQHVSMCESDVAQFFNFDTLKKLCLKLNNTKNKESIVGVFNTLICFLTAFPDKQILFFQPIYFEHLSDKLSCFKFVLSFYLHNFCDSLENNMNQIDLLEISDSLLKIITLCISSLTRIKEKSCLLELIQILQHINQTENDALILNSLNLLRKIMDCFQCETFIHFQKFRIHKINLNQLFSTENASIIIAILELQSIIIMYSHAERFHCLDNGIIEFINKTLLESLEDKYNDELQHTCLCFILDYIDQLDDKLDIEIFLSKRIIWLLSDHINDFPFDSKNLSLQSFARLYY